MKKPNIKYDEVSDTLTISFKPNVLATGIELTAYLAMFLNLNRINTSMLGVSNAPMANKYIARTIIS